MEEKQAANQAAGQGRKLQRGTKIMAAGLAGLLALTGCAVNERAAAQSAHSTLSGELVGTGASSQAAAQEVWVSGFQADHPSVTVNYEPAGSGAGRGAFEQGAADFAATDRPLTVEEIRDGHFLACSPDSGLVQLPAYLSPLAIVFNVQGVEALNADAQLLAAIFAGHVTSWDDPAIAQQNPGTTFPPVQITPVHRSDSSGSTGALTEYFASAAPTMWEFGPTESWPKGLGGEGAQGTSGVVEAVTNGHGTIGYADASRAGELPAVRLLSGETYTEYSEEAAAAALAGSSREPGRGSSDLAVRVDHTSTKPGIYPLVLISYLVGCETYENPTKAELVRSYFMWIGSEEGQLAAARGAGSAPVSKELQKLIGQAAAKIGGRQ